ncbi:hypothetical protein ALNOE001_05380 [Candidatus Methanobinarius endosymbioticus]|uniref:DUF488 domain-containing protein n=1 Tax=Candidatus Methanobinarius endosymbioticus TaxID=2006182 RepID=A0A366ME80_9EURY|nr:hypothetical protein ALNOE001_05380 [Candidatus Methanobinarius endosymbioticus]
MEIFTMVSSRKSAEEFFNNINQNKIELVLDVRLHNHSQLLGFTKGTDLEYFLDNISSCKYVHDERFCQTEEVLENYRKKIINWEEFEKKYLEFIEKRDMVTLFNKKYGNLHNVLILCSGKSPKTCHGRLLAQKLAKPPKKVIYL